MINALLFDEIEYFIIQYISVVMQLDVRMVNMYCKPTIEL